MKSYVLVSALLAAGQAMAGSYYLDFEDGLLPSAHGWIFEGPTESASYSVSGGILTGDTLSPPALGGRYSIPGAYNSSIDMSFEVRARLIGATSFYGAAFGVYTPAEYAEVGLGEDFVGVVHAPTPDVETFILTPTRDGFHTYRLTSSGGSGSFEVRIDGALVFQGDMRPNTLSIPNRIMFGDLTNGGDAHWEIDYLSFQNDPVPEPASVGLIGLGLGLVYLLPKRNRV